MIIILLLTLYIASAAADDISSSTWIHLVTDPIDTSQRPGLPLDGFGGFAALSDDDDDAVSQLYLIQVEKPDDDITWGAISSVDFIPDNAYLVSATRAQLATLRNTTRIRWVGQLQPHQKLHPSLNRTGSRPMSAVLVTIRALDPESVAERRRAQLPPQTPVQVARQDRLRVELSPGAPVDPVLDVLARDPAVVMIERRWRPLLMNRWTRGILQNGLTASADYATRTGLVAWDAGLSGQGQVLGLADSGLDANSCLLRDDNGAPVPFVSFRPRPTAADLPASPRHRKVVQYVQFADNTDDADGHGTHVAGIAAGSPSDRTSQYIPFQGMAPEAKIAFFDIGKSSGQLSIPDDLTSMLEYAYLAGARVHSNSWGTESNSYDSLSRDMDQFMFEHSDMLIVVAAGNAGDCATMSTVSSPSTAKNVISVAASMTNLESYQTTGRFPPGFTQFPSTVFDENNIAVFSSRGPTADLRIKPDLTAPGFNALSARSGSSNGCDQPSSNVLTSKSGTSMAAPALAGALLLIRQYFVEGFYPTGRRNASNAFAPAGSLMKAIAIAGGRRLTGSRLISDQFTKPSGAQQCPGPQFASIAQAPGIDQGWGRLQLSSVLEMRDNVTSSPFFLYLLGGTSTQVSIGADETHSYRMCLVPSSSAPPDAAHKVVLAWTDPPGQPFSAIQLVNDLDLEVAVANSTVLLGNQGAYQGSGPDRRNPVEVVVLQAGGNGRDLVDVEIRIRAVALRLGPRQNYSLVVTGLLRPFGCDLIQSGAASLNDKGPILPRSNVNLPPGAGPASAATTNLFQATTIAAAVVGGLVVLLFIFALAHKMRSM